MYGFLTLASRVGGSDCGCRYIFWCDFKRGETWGRKMGLGDVCGKFSDNFILSGNSRYSHCWLSAEELGAIGCAHFKFIGLPMVWVCRGLTLCLSSCALSTMCIGHWIAWVCEDRLCATSCAFLKCMGLLLQWFLQGRLCASSCDLMRYQKSLVSVWKAVVFWRTLVFGSVWNLSLKDWLLIDFSCVSLPAFWIDCQTLGMTSITILHRVYT